MAQADYQTQVRAMTTLAAPASGFKQPLFCHPLQPGSSHQQANLISLSEQKRQAAAKGLNRVETLTSMGANKPQYPMFPLEDNKKAMI